MSFKTLWRALLPLLGVWLLSTTAANAMFLSADPIGTKDDPNLYLHVGLDPINNTDPTGLATCGASLSRYECRQAMTQQTTALQAVRGARADLANLSSERAAVAAGDQSALSGRATDTETALANVFDSTTDATIATADSMLANTEGFLADRSGRYTYEAASTSHLRSLGGRVPPGADVPGYSYDGASSVWLFPSFRADTLVHEPPHIFGANRRTDDAYGPAALALARRPGGTRLALNNADSYLLLVRSLRPF